MTAHHFEETIGGRVYHVEVVGAINRWRVNLRRGPGMPTAVMPFYGRTPVEMPGVSQPPAPAPQPPRVDRTEPLAPLPNRLVGDRHASLREEIFGIAEAEAEPMVEPDRVADDVGQESISMIAGRLAPHRPTLPLVASI